MGFELRRTEFRKSEPPLSRDEVKRCPCDSASLILPIFAIFQNTFQETLRRHGTQLLRGPESCFDDRLLSPDVAGGQSTQSLKGSRMMAPQTKLKWSEIQCSFR